MSESRLFPRQGKGIREMAHQRAQLALKPTLCTQKKERRAQEVCNRSST
jgi:hypothetical protein